MKPKILISACFLGQDCRYDGGNNASKIPAEILAKLARNFELLSVCPEQLGGLPTPREPAEIRANGRVITKFSRTDVTDEFLKGARICVELQNRAFKAKKPELRMRTNLRRQLLGEGNKRRRANR